ncbi:MAG: hypothetical protein ACK5MU_04190 [Candidatus Saccharimonadales bacterium]
MSCEALVECRAEELVEQLGSRQLSVLKSLKAHKLRLEMSLVGRLCQFIVWLIYIGPRSKLALKKRAAAWVKFFFPIRYCKNDYRVGDAGAAGVVVYFNHQSLFEVLATIYFCMTTFPDKRYLFPVNLPWYEGLCPVLKRLDGLDVCIMPMITPSTKEKLDEIADGDATMLHAIEVIKHRFEEHFGERVVDFLMAGDLIAVAPSATRTPYIFPSYDAYIGRDKKGIKKMPRSIEAIVMSLRRRQKGELNVVFIPFVATRKKRAGRGLNVWRRHDVYVGEMDDFETVALLQKARVLSYEFYRKLAEYVPDDVKYDHDPAPEPEAPT